MKIEVCRTLFVNNIPVSFQEKINVIPEYYKALRKKLTVKKIVDKNFVRLGKPHDGGYIMVDNFNRRGGIAYSFGIADDVSWDWDMARRGYDIFMYDPTIDALPYNHEKFHFFQEGILGIEVKEKRLNTLENFIRRNGHEGKSNMILKMDVEGAEWSFLSTVTSETLNQFDQMVFEFHDMIKPKDQSVMNATLACIAKINRTHSLVHLHVNNCGSILTLDDKILIPDLFELTYVKTSNYELVDDENICLPIPLDASNNGGTPDIPLGFWNKMI
ncbi:MAG: FkbM family methyltransferase [Selenomonadaceae bacterium]|nr:FkbM family methyltransferase [Selenomonadaceae bacterium]